MFWFAPKALAAIHNATNDVVEFDFENGKQDGTLAHAWERTFCLLARDAGYLVASNELGAQDLFSIESKANVVPVLSAGISK